MKKIICVVSIVLYNLIASACDVCGGNTSGNQLGLLPQNNKHFFGIRYQYSGFISTPHVGSSISSSSKEQLNTFQIWGKVALQKHLNVFVFLPYKINNRVVETNITTVKGIGDCSLLLLYTFFNTNEKVRNNFSHALQLGSGIKLPTGNYQKVQDGIMLNPNIQAGTGSYDFPINLIYTLKYKNLGVNTEINCTKNGTNKQHFQFGNKATSHLRLFGIKQIKQVSTILNGGISYENTQPNFQNKTQQEYTGGNGFFGNIGLDVYYKTYGMNLQFQQPFHQHIGEGYIQNHPRVMINFIYLF